MVKEFVEITIRNSFIVRLNDFILAKIQYGHHLDMLFVGQVRKITSTGITILKPNYHSSFVSEPQEYVFYKLDQKDIKYFWTKRYATLDEAKKYFLSKNK